MSRREIPAKRPDLVVTIGWDNPMATFFAQVEETRFDEEEEPRILLWLGQTDREILTPEALAPLLAPYAALSANMIATLRQDRIAMLDRAPTRMQRLRFR